MFDSAEGFCAGSDMSKVTAPRLSFDFHCVKMEQQDQSCYFIYRPGTYQSCTPLSKLNRSSPPLPLLPQRLRNSGTLLISLRLIGLDQQEWTTAALDGRAKCQYWKLAEYFFLYMAPKEAVKPCSAEAAPPQGITFLSPEQALIFGVYASVRQLNTFCCRKALLCYTLILLKEFMIPLVH